MVPLACAIVLDFHMILDWVRVRHRHLRQRQSQHAMARRSFADAAGECVVVVHCRSRSRWYYRFLVPHLRKKNSSRSDRTSKRFEKREGGPWWKYRWDARIRASATRGVWMAGKSLRSPDEDDSSLVVEVEV